MTNTQFGRRDYSIEFENFFNRSACRFRWPATAVEELTLHESVLVLAGFLGQSIHRERFKNVIALKIDTPTMDL